MTVKPNGSGPDTATNHANGTAPPAYTPVAGAPPPSGPPQKLSEKELADLNSAFSSLSLPTVVNKIEVNTCLAHLKLLSAFNNLKEDIGYTDGLWGIHDLPATQGTDGTTDPGAMLAKLREKRWALYVARAVDRYEAWWNTLASDPLTIDQMTVQSPKYGEFTNSNTIMNWLPQMLPPLGLYFSRQPAFLKILMVPDVLMVWHAHMLNPRDYLEDCIRTGRKDLWTTGMPWKLVSEAIDTSFDYTVSEDCTAAWRAATGRSWDNTDDPLTKSLRCPACSEPHEIPWTTCSLPADSKDVRKGLPDLVGSGYGDGDFSFICFRCSTTINRDYLEVAKFVKDVKALLAGNHPMPGTVLDYKTGLPEKLMLSIRGGMNLEQCFPNRLLQNHLRSEVLELIQPDQHLRPITMDTVRTMIEDAIKDHNIVKQVEAASGIPTLSRYRLTQRSRVPIRKMMSHYWGNHSPFSLELGGAVMRQGIFTEKMHKVCTPFQIFCKEAGAYAIAD